MDDLSDWIAVGAVVVAVAFGLWGVIVAHRANGRSRDANKLAGEANTIAREALEMQKTTLPPSWGPVVELSDHLFGMQNTSGRNIMVDRVMVDPDDAAGMVRRKSDARPERVEYGDYLQLAINGAWQLSPEVLTLVWHFEDDDLEQQTVRRL